MVLYGRNVSYKRKLSTKVTTTATGMPQLTPPGYPGTRGTHFVPLARQYLLWYERRCNTEGTSTRVTVPGYPPSGT
eukprot:378934-Rhodomonas_salina.1